MKIEFLAFKGDKEKLLYVVNTNLMQYEVIWPDSSLFLTNNFDSGTEFIRISELEVNDYLFNDTLDRVLLFVQTPFSTGVCNLPGTLNRILTIVDDQSYTLVGNQFNDIIDRLISIESIIQGEP